MKKLIIAVAIALLVMLAISPTVALADDPTTTVVTWSGSGGVGATVNSGDAVTSFSTGGNHIYGSFTVTDSNDNPYSYGVDTFTAYLNASTTNGGYMEMLTDRLTSKSSMYGPAGQQSSTYVYTYDGTASMAVRTWTNYAAMKDPTYTYQLSGGHNIIVNSSLYAIDRRILDGQGNQSYIVANGSGSAILDCMSSEASGNGGVRLGWGCGCYTDANFSGTGAGYVSVTGVGDDYVKFEGMGVQSGGGTLQFIADWINNFSIADYSLTAH